MRHVGWSTNDLPSPIGGPGRSFDRSALISIRHGQTYRPGTAKSGRPSSTGMVTRWRIVSQRAWTWESTDMGQSLSQNSLHVSWHGWLEIRTLVRISYPVNLTQRVAPTDSADPETSSKRAGTHSWHRSLTSFPLIAEPVLRYPTFTDIRTGGQPLTHHTLLSTAAQANKGALTHVRFSD